MSNGRSHRRRNRVQRPNLADAARLACRIGGCRCDVWLTMVEIEPGIYSTNCQHDHDCPLLLRKQARWN